jgi:hypothetical protein
MKTKYIHMSMLIQGPKQLGNDINLYLELLKEELHTLWTPGVRTWDACAGDYFPMSRVDHDGARLSRIQIWLRSGVPWTLRMHKVH